MKEYQKLSKSLENCKKASEAQRKNRYYKCMALVVVLLIVIVLLLFIPVFFDVVIENWLILLGGMIALFVVNHLILMKSRKYKDSEKEKKS